ncbi:hydroxypyruvate isomerase family protein [Roseovarius sp. EL26]|uniref:hydroxypyruvate isomerase family protein n=1 Tax=Roseovarius sp. EL26 TaxID=2126672 RepID=UPI000EA3413A|nr:TIM barrel protein [Roseovarius sp. EL26]
MPRFAANLSLLFTERPFLSRFAAAKVAGFDAVEMLFPYAHPKERILQEIELNELSLVLINTAAGDWEAGERGFAAVPGAQELFRTGFLQALEWAQDLNARFVHIMAGNAQGAEAKETFVDNLRWAVDVAGEQKLTIEPINPVDMPLYFLNNFDLARDVLETVNAANLHLQFDAYHAHRITGNALRAWDNFGSYAAHVQVAGVDGRHEPTSDIIDYAEFFEVLDAVKYAGVVSGEYFPKGRTEDGLSWIRSTL